MIKKLLPLLDHLYIFQQLEYEPISFLRWFALNPLKRNLQKKHKLVVTSKVLAILSLTLFLEVIESLYLSSALFHTFWYSLLIFLLLQLIGPIYIVIAWAIFLPLEEWQKSRIINQAKQKLAGLPNLQVVAIAGSFAKTSTKDMLYTLLWKDKKVVKTPKSYNTLISIARSVLTDVKPNTEVFLVEMDAYHPGEIKKLTEIVHPSLGIITSIAPQHLERFGSMDNLAKTQFELAESLPENGTLFLNSASDWILKLEKNYSQTKQFFGDRVGTDDFYATDIKQTEKGLEFKLNTPQGSTVIALPLFGNHHIGNFLAAASVATKLGLTLNQIKKRVQFIQPTPHRLEIKKSGEVTIIDNSYNTNPIASRASLQVLKEYPGKQRIIITPGLVELGKEHNRENKAFAKEFAQVADQVIVVGKFAKKPLLAGLKEVKFAKEKTHQVASVQEGLNLLKQLLKPQTVVLLENDLPDQYS